MPTREVVTPQQKDSYRQEGYMILPGIIPPDTLTMLREECSYFVGYYDAQMDSAGVGVQGLNHRGKRYFISMKYRLSHRLWRFVFSPLMAQLTQAVLGPNVYLFYEQWVVKGAEQGMKFAWHQDSGYLVSSGNDAYCKPYLTCWCTLDDVSEANGTVYLLPHSRGGTRHKIFKHTKENATNDLVGFTGDDPGDPIIAPAGSIVAFTSYNLHRSGPNTTPNMRRVYLAQYSDEPIIRRDGCLQALAVPFLRDGRMVYDHADDSADRYGPVVDP